MDVRGVIRRWSRAIADQRILRLTNYESLAVAQVEPPGLEGTRGGVRFLLGSAAAVTGIAPVTAFPTTTAQWVIFNNDPAAGAGGKTYYFEELGMYLTSGTPGAGYLLLASIFQAPVQVGSNVTGASVSPAGGIAGVAGSSQKSNAIIKTGVTVTGPAAPNWFQVATQPFVLATPAAFPAAISLENRNLQGSIAVPPQFGLALAVVGPAGTTPLFAPFAKWLELATDNE